MRLIPDPMAVPAWLTEGVVEQLAEHPDGPATVFPVLQVAGVKRAGTNGGASERFRLLLSDGVHSQQCVLATALNGLVKDGTLRPGSIVHLAQTICSTIQNRRVFIVCKLDVLHSECPMFGTPKMYQMKISPEEQEPNLPASAAQTNSGIYMDGGAMLDLLASSSIPDGSVITMGGDKWSLEFPYEAARDFFGRFNCRVSVP